MLTYFLFVAMLSLVANNYREPNEYRISRALEHVTKGEYFNEVRFCCVFLDVLSCSSIGTSVNVVKIRGY